MQLEMPPHGGKLINRRATPEQAEELRGRAPELPQIHLANRRLSDLEMIAVGAFSPVEGFMGRADYENVVVNKRLANGLPWPIPITLAVPEEEADALTIGKEAALINDTGELLAVLEVEEKYRYDRGREARLVYGTTEIAHPGVAALRQRGEIHVAGRVTVVKVPNQDEFAEYRLEPQQTRAEFARRGWRRIVGFQTRNPIHRAHEYLQKCALETVDGILLHPLVGATKSDDVPPDIRMRSYEVLIENYYPKDRIILAVLPAAMRYAGPREAIFHALLRKNYGCTHFIVGRDHAGVGNYYGTYDAQYIFDEFDPGELGIQPIFFDHSFFCKRCGSMASIKTCPHPKEDHVFLSGSKVRELLSSGQCPPPEITRPEVAEILISYMAKK